MIKANVVSDNSNWKKIIKKPDDYLEKRLKVLSKVPLFRKKNQEFTILLTNDKEMKSIKKNKTDTSVIVAERLAKKAQEKNISKIYFDRGIYKYHGRVKIFAETLRKNGMKF